MAVDPRSLGAGTEPIDVIRQFRLIGRFEDGHSYFQGLPPDIQRRPLVLWQVVTLYINQGHFIRAEAALALGGHNAAFDTEEAALLHILHAYIALNRKCQLSSAVQIAQEVCEAMLNYRGTCFSLISVQGS